MLYFTCTVSFQMGNKYAGFCLCVSVVAGAGLWLRRSQLQSFEKHAEVTDICYIRTKDI